MGTKERILDASRKLFNENGLANVSVRDICNDIGISAGNFNYHFPDKDIVVECLYTEMLQKTEQTLGQMTNSEVSIVTHLHTHKELCKIQQAYKFVYLNMFQLVTQYPKIKSIYVKNIQRERKLAAQIFSMYVAKGVIKKSVTSEQFERILNVGQIINNTWLVDAEILYNGNKKMQLKYYMLICCGLLEPYLTESSLKEYHAYFNNM